MRIRNAGQGRKGRWEAKRCTEPSLSSFSGIEVIRKDRDADLNGNADLADLADFMQIAMRGLDAKGAMKQSDVLSLSKWCAKSAMRV